MEAAEAVAAEAAAEAPKGSEKAPAAEKVAALEGMATTELLSSSVQLPRDARVGFDPMQMRPPDLSHAHPTSLPCQQLQQQLQNQPLKW